ncbi:MAG: hypothetical protein IJS40_04425 [Synergistaceae bacterium]|nr:hypothetical protein [Synergistaceae bacterium]
MIYIEPRAFDMLSDAKSNTVFKIFLYIALKQPAEGVQGFTINKKELQADLNLKKSVFFRDLHWLKKNLLIQELKFIDHSDFMVNPYIVMNNGDRDARIKEWARRQSLDIERERRLRKARRLKQLRDAKKANSQPEMQDK